MTNDHRKNLSQPADSIDRSKNGPSAESIDAQWPSLLTEVIEHATVGVFITDANGVILYANQHHCEQSGYDLEEIIGQNPKMFQSGKTSRDIYENMWATIRAGNTWRGELLNRRKNGEIYWEFTCISPVPDDTGRPRHYFAIKKETLGRSSEDHFSENIADITDALTGLLNRSTFHGRVDRAIQKYANQTGPNTPIVAYLDID